MALRVMLVKSAAGASEEQLRTLRGLGLSNKLGQPRLLQDTPAIRGMVFKIKHLVRSESTSEQAPVRQRRKPGKILRRDSKRAKAEPAKPKP